MKHVGGCDLPSAGCHTPPPLATPDAWCRCIVLVRTVLLNRLGQYAIRSPQVEFSRPSKIRSTPAAQSAPEWGGAPSSLPGPPPLGTWGGMTHPRCFARGLRSVTMIPFVSALAPRRLSGDRINSRLPDSCRNAPKEDDFVGPSFCNSHTPDCSCVDEIPPVGFARTGPFFPHKSGSAGIFPLLNAPRGDVGVIVPPPVD